MKKALVDSNGDPAAAEKLLKEKGLAAVAKRSDRAAGEGRIFVKQDGNRIAIVEMTCETDFVAKNDDFIALGEKLVSITLEKNYTEVAQEHKDLMQELAIKIRENMEVRRVALVTIPENAVASTYVHHNFKIGAVVVVKGSTDEKVAHFAHECCLHLAVNNPSYITKEEVLGVGFGACDYDEAVARYNPETLEYGYNTMPDGEEIYFIPNPALGLWINKEKF